MSLKGDLGVYLVAYELMRRDWDVTLNLGKITFSQGKFNEYQGYDILALKNDVIRIEVKFVDSFTRGEAYKKNLTQRLTETEFQICDFVIVVLYHQNGHTFYIIPKDSLLKEKIVYKGKNGYTLPIYYREGFESKRNIEKFKVRVEDDWKRLLGC